MDRETPHYVFLLDQGVLTKVQIGFSMSRVTILLPKLKGLTTYLGHLDGQDLESDFKFISLDGNRGKDSVMIDTHPVWSQLNHIR